MRALMDDDVSLERAYAQVNTQAATQVGGISWGGI
jgi:hypothetical protein